MATTAVPLTAPHYMKDVSLVIGPSSGTQYEFKQALEELTFVPNSPVSTWTGIGGLVLTDVDNPSWTVQAKYVQDWETPTSFANYLHQNPGLVTDCVFKPKAAGAKSVTAKVVLVPGQIGGGKGIATATVTFGVQGTPTLA